MGRVESLRTENKFKKTEVGEIPVDWEVARIGDTCEVVGGSTPLTTTKEFWDGDIPWAIPTDITKLKGNIISITEKIITERGLSNCAARLLPVGSILLTSRATIGECAINSKPMATNQGFASLICKDKVYNWFIFYRIKYMRKEIERLGNGSTFNEVSKKSIRELKIPIPPLSEQKKIAEILTSMDEAIEKKQEIIEKTKMLKKGLMQELLARGIGHKKFQKTEIGEIPVDWEVYCLGDYAYIKARIGWRGLSASEYTDEGPLLIAGNHIKRTKILWDKCDHISQYRYDESPEIKLKNGDIILSKDGTIGRLGFIERLPQEATIGGTMMMIRPDENLFFSKFVYFYFQGEYFQKLIKEKISGSSIPHIFQRDIVNLKIPFLLLPEQRKIAEILTSVDEEIENEMAHKERLESIKKGLMQVLLTGKIRAKI